MAARLTSSVLRSTAVGASLRNSCRVTLTARPAFSVAAGNIAKRAIHQSAKVKRATVTEQSFDEVPEEQYILPSKLGKKLNTIDITTPTGRQLNLSARWLRDHCHCKECINQDTLQRNFDSFTNNDNTALNVQSTEEGVQITWKETGHISTYPWTWLSRNISSSPPPPIKRTFWGAEIAKNPPSVHYDDVMASDEGVGKWTALIAEWGFAFVDGCPTTPEATEKLLERIAFIRITHYGGFYDFTADLSHKDTAYTNLALPAHTDNTYFTDPSGLQMFHLLSHTGEPREPGGPIPSTPDLGGRSLLVDGFHCAAQLGKENPEAYEILAKTPVNWHASGNEGITITPATKFPVLNHDTETGELVQLRWNNDDRASMPMVLGKGVEGKEVTYDMWFDAAQIWNEIITRPQNEYWEQLKPGRPVVFDNWRVMHARSAFTGKRRMAGGYVNRDDWWSRYWNTNIGREKVLSRFI